MAVTDNSYFDVDLFLPDADVIARQVVSGKQKLGKYSPSMIDLAVLIKDIKVSDAMKGSSTLVITVADPEWTLMDSGFFDADQDGKLDAIDVNYPEDSEFWWRLQNSDIEDSPPGHSMNFMERAACDMMAHKGPMKTSRAKRTRAEFLSIAAAHVKKRPIHFHSRELHKKQDIDKDKDKKTPKAKEKDKDKGINKDSKITFTNWDGNEYTLQPGELENAETALDAAGTDDERALLVLLCAGIVEGPFFRNPTQANSDGDSAGFLQLRAMHGSESDRRDIAWTTKKFMNEGFTGQGGAIKLAKAHKDWSVGRVAQAVQGSAYPARYDKVKDGAKKILEAGGGAGSGGGTYTKQYNFEIGSTDNPHENFWDGSNRLAEEVKWAFFLDGQDLYFDAETTLIKQKPVAVIDRDDPAVVSWGGTYDNRNIATEANLVLICDMFEYRAGQVLKLERMGPLSTGSTAKLPGRWLISEIERSRYELSSTFTLKQPEEPAPEPAPETGTRSDDSGSSGEGVKAMYDRAGEISHQNLPYVWGGGHQSAGSPSGGGYDCSGYVAACLVAGGQFKKGDPVPRSDMLGAMYESGEGDEATIWSSPDHVFLVFSKESDRADTSPQSGDKNQNRGPHLRGRANRNTSGFKPSNPMKKK